MFSSLTDRVPYTGNNSTKVYSYGCRIFASTDLKVTVRLIAAPYTETLLTLTTDYSVGGIGNASGSITLVDASQAWLTSGNLRSTYKIIIRRVRPLTQTTSIRNSSAYYASIHEDTFDHLVMIAQQLQDEADRSVKLSETFTSAEFDPTLPVAIAGAASLTLVTKSDGTGFALGPSLSTIQAAIDAVGTTAASAAAAASSATAASSSATAAAASQSAAATSATAAASSATSAASSATSATSSASSATTSATSATASASSATSSAAAASASQSAAATSATSAASSATSATSSSSSASISVTNAATSATAAAVSAAAAAVSAALYGPEMNATIANSQGSAADVTGALFVGASNKLCLVEYIIQRITTGAGATVLIEAGTLILIYDATSGYRLTQGPSGSDDSGVVFSITAGGQVQYTSSNITGTASVSKVSFILRKLVG